jgi:hypothetical protein
MWIEWILIAALTVAIVCLTVCYCRTVERKDRRIVRHIMEKARLEKLLDETVCKNNKLKNRLQSMLTEQEDKC